MPRKSTVKTLPPELLAEVNRILADDICTLDELVAYLRDAGHERSRSALHRHKKRQDRVAKRLRQSREMATALVQEIGPSVSEGRTGRMLVEILQSLVFDHMLIRVEAGDGEQGETDDELSSQDFFFLAKSIKELASASKLTTDQEMKLRERFVDQAIAIVDEANQVAKQEGEPGLSDQTIDKLKRDLLGIRDKSKA